MKIMYQRILSLKNKDVLNLIYRKIHIFKMNKVHSTLLGSVMIGGTSEDYKRVMRGTRYKPGFCVDCKYFGFVRLFNYNSEKFEQVCGRCHEDRLFDMEIYSFYM